MTRWCSHKIKVHFALCQCDWPVNSTIVCLSASLLLRTVADWLQERKLKCNFLSLNGIRCDMRIMNKMLANCWLLLAVSVGGCAEDSEPPGSEGPSQTQLEASSRWIDDASFAGERTDQWLSYGRDFSEQRFVPLTQINKDTIGQLGLAYRVDIGTRIGSVATPLLVDGLLIFPTMRNIVVAVDTRSGRERWRFDPQIDLKFTRVYSAALSRGVAVYQDKVLIATMDGRLIAVGIKDGRKIWETDTFDGGNCRVEGQLPACYISGAPRVARGKVFIGFGGAELNARGYMSAFDVETGALQWRFYTVPRDPQDPEHPEMETAAKTWSAGWWEGGLGGGGTVWDSMAFDEELNQLIIGTGNAGAAYPRHIRSPGGGDNLFLASIIALDVETGRMKWYYQQVPGEQWDYTATQSLILADLEFDGAMKKVVMQAPKNGFFYVLDRNDGKLILAEKFAKVTWASHVDKATGRPVESANADYSKSAQWVYPTPVGANNFQPMAFNPETGLAYISGREGPFVFGVDRDIVNGQTYKVTPGVINPGLELRRAQELIMEAGPPPGVPQGYLKAFDPVAGRLAWQKPMRHIWNGGVLTTAGGLVFVGDTMGFLEAYDAQTGDVLWSFNTFRSLIATPISYALDGEQYVAILAGTGAGANQFGYTGRTASYLYGNEGQLMVFKLGGQVALEEPPMIDRNMPEPPAQIGNAADIEVGDVLYHMHCFSCHGVGARSSEVVPDLRKMLPATHGLFKGIVLQGWFEPRGMLGFGDILDERQAEQIHAYLIDRAHQAYQQEGGDEVEFSGVL